MFKKLKNKKGFTLTELIVVIVIIGILAAVLIPTLTGYITKANKSVDEQKVASLNTLLIEAQVNEKNFEDALELKEYLEDEMDYDGDYSLKVEGSYMWYDTKKRKISIITETDEPTLKKLSTTDTPMFVSEGNLKSPEGLMQYSSEDEVWLIGGNGYLFDLVEEIRNIGNSGELSGYKNLPDGTVKNVLASFFKNYSFSGAKGIYNVSDNGDVVKVEGATDRLIVKANSKKNLAELFHNEVVREKIADINKTLLNTPVSLELNGYNVTVKIKSEGSISNAASGVLQIIELLIENGCTVGYVIPKKYNSFAEYEEVLKKIVERYNNYIENNGNDSIEENLYNIIKRGNNNKIDLEYMEAFYKINLSSVDVTDCLAPVTLALCLKINDDVYDAYDSTLCRELFNGKDPIRLIGVFESGKYSGLVAQYDFEFDVEQ